MSKIPQRPVCNYSTGHASGFIPSQIEAEIDRNKENYKREVVRWWESLTRKDQKRAWKADKQLFFYVSKPK